MNMPGKVVYSSTKLDNAGERVTLVTIRLTNGGQIKIKANDTSAAGMEVGRTVNVHVAAITTEDE